MKPALVLLALASLTLTCLIIVGMASGELAALLNPRVMPRTLAGSLILTLASLVALLRALFGNEGLGRLAPGEIWPLLVPLALVPAALMATSSEQSQLRLFTASGQASAAGPETGWVVEENPDLLAVVEEYRVHEAPATQPLGAASAGRAAASGSRSDAAAVQQLLAVSDPIAIDSSDFTHRTNLIWDAPQAFAGRRIRVKGFVYRRDDWPADTFVVARMSIWCCAADAAVVGFVARVPEPGSAPVSGQWIEVEAELRTRERFEAGVVRMENIPELTRVTWQATSVPAQEYVFP